MLDNSGELDHLRRQMDELIVELRRLAAEQVRPFVLVTGNRGKIAEARLAPWADLEAAELDLPEIQSLDYLEVPEAKAEEAWRQARPAAGGRGGGPRPGRPERLPRPPGQMDARGRGSRGHRPRPPPPWATPAPPPAASSSIRTRPRRWWPRGGPTGTLVLPGRGTHGFGWDPVFLPEGSPHTFAELTGPEKDAVSHRGKAWREMARRSPGSRLFREMIQSFTIKNFKSFREATLPLAPLTVLIGANASGKSNAVEAMQLLSWLASGRVP